MKIHEFVGKKILKEYGINVPESVFIKNFPPEKGIIPSVIKSQVLVGGRMKSGGVLFADNGEEFLRNTEILLKKPIKGEFPYGVLAEEKIKINHEYYISAVLNREKRSEEWIFSEEGGIEIENSENIKKGSYEEILNTVPEKFRTFLPKLKKIFNEKDLTLLEINPVAEDTSGNLTALDCVMHVDDNALFRQPWAKKFTEDDHDFHYVELDGNIGIIGCGAGIVMATMDAVKNAGYSPANFLDIGGGADKETTLNALNLLKSKNIKITVMNIFGGITKCDVIANSILEFKEINKDIKLFIRLTGTNEEEAGIILEKNNIKNYKDLDEMINALDIFLKKEVHNND
ncbi:MAG: succinyl-CoA synthetase [Thermotogae bacterium]|nr:succinyl-CoA synthetase [Thermotogota bacterium]